MLRLRDLMICVMILVVIASLASAQESNSTAGEEVQLTARDVRVMFAPPGTAANLIEFQADPQSGVGGDVFDVVSSDARAAISLILPDGTEVNAANAEALGFTYVTIPDGTFENSMILNPFSTNGTHTLITLPASALPGVYKIKGNVSTVPPVTDPSDNVVIVASYFSSSSIMAGLQIKSQYRVGEPIVLAGLLFNDSTPVTDATVTATIEETSQPGAAQVQVTMPDSGTFDDRAGDGIYTGVFSSNHPGTFSLAVRATGLTPSGVRYSRVVSSSFRVLSPLASFTTFQDAGVDDDFDGLIDRVVIKANIDTQTAGRYQFGLHLLASNGQEINTSTFADLEQGAQEVEVSFTAEDILSLGVNGPYLMKDALLTFQDDADIPVADSRANAGNTAAYELSTLHHSALFFTGQNTATGIDTNGNGKYDVLRVQCEVLVNNPGFYEWSGTLGDPTEQQIDFSDTTGFLNAGSNIITFNFDGSKIGQRGLNGPYNLRSVLLLGAGESIIVDRLFDTQPFSFKEFENSDILKLGAVVASETDGDQDNVIEPGEDGSLSVRLLNGGAAGVTGVRGTLTTQTPGVTMTGGQSAYPDLAASASGDNSTPFTFTTASGIPCGSSLDFTLTINYDGDGGNPDILHFSVPTGQGGVTTVSYTGPPAAIPDSYSPGVNVPLTVSGLPNSITDLNFLIGGSSCTTATGATTVGLDHTFASDLVIRLTSPQGTTVTLINRTGGSGQNFCNTLLDDEGAVTSIQSTSTGNAPFTGTFLPANPLAAFRGQDPNGTWVLNVSDLAGADIGSVRAFSLIFASPAVCADNGAPKTIATRSALPNAAGWNNNSVAVAFNATDNKGGSGVREITYSATGAQSIPEVTIGGASTSLNIAAEGLTNITFYARDNAGNTEAAQTMTVNIDQTAPTIAITAPGNTSYVLGQTVAASYSCSDGRSGVASCVGTVPSGSNIDTSSTGTKTFVVTATDVAGNVLTSSVSYTVVNNAVYAVHPLYDTNKAHKAGSTIPIKIQLFDAFGRNVSSPALIVHAIGVIKDSDYAPGPVEDAGNANPDDNFRFTNFSGAGGYMFNLKTAGLNSGTYRVIFRVGTDAFTYGAQFQIK